MFEISINSMLIKGGIGILIKWRKPVFVVVCNLMNELSFQNFSTGKNHVLEGFKKVWKTTCDPLIYGCICQFYSLQICFFTKIRKKFLAKCNNNFKKICCNFQA